MSTSSTSLVGAIPFPEDNPIKVFDQRTRETTSGQCAMEPPWNPFFSLVNPRCSNPTLVVRMPLPEDHPIEEDERRILETYHVHTKWNSSDSCLLQSASSCPSKKHHWSGKRSDMAREDVTDCWSGVGGKKSQKGGLFPRSDVHATR